MPVSLHRGFNRPPIDPSTQTLSLEIAEAQGVISASLNGEILEKKPGGEGCWIYDLDAAKPSANELILELNPALVAKDVEWGRVCLVIASRWRDLADRV